MTKIQSGVVQTILNDNGSLSHYRLTLFVPKEYAELVDYENIQVKGKKYMYCPVNKDFDKLMQIMTSAQVTIADMKLVKLNERREELLMRLQSFNNQ